MGGRVEVTGDERGEALRQLRGLTRLLPPGQAAGIAYAIDHEPDEVEVESGEGDRRYWHWRGHRPDTGWVVLLYRRTGKLVVDYREDLGLVRAARSRPAEWVE